MKFFAGLVCLMALCVVYSQAMLSPEMKEKLMEGAAECKPKTGATDDDVESIMKHEIPTTDTGKCFLGCMKQHFGVITSDFKVDVDRMKDMLAPLKEKNEELYNQMVEIGEECGGKATGSNECELAVSLMECAKAKAQEMGIDKSKFM